MYNYEDIVETNHLSKKLIEKFWPGPLTIIFKSKVQFAEGVTLNGKVSLRMPKDDFCQKLLSETKFPLISTSANISGNPAVNNYEELKLQFPMISVVDCGIVSQVNPSTIVDISDNILKIVREGQIKKQELIDSIK